MSCARNVAAVAVIVRGAHDGAVVPGTTGPITSHGAALATSEHADMLFIQRATDERDRWSGHVAFPGGRCAPGESPLQTVVREVHEEIGVDLRDASMFTFVGRLRPLVKAGADLIIHAFVVVQVSPGPLVVVRDAREVADVFWVSLRRLHRSAVDFDVYAVSDFVARYPPALRVVFRSLPRQWFALPAIAVDGAPRYLWGISLELVRSLLSAANHDARASALSPRAGAVLMTRSNELWLWLSSNYCCRRSRTTG
ncbi:unnamed protein product (mitochondrion) [Plasmodiophora brassicae]|uniref:Nudix hydrolase domain-containing protein n=2 Tax=Plasmodiophora brassicae TaxID=37360 RepID=A0A3P3YHJ9_PLABS|nr:unnamed protein product [Plasmodiophora brassicae]